MGRKHHVQDATTQYGFTLEYVERQETNLDGLRDWYKWNSDDGRFTVCCDDACDDSGRHAIHIFQTGDFKYRPEVYLKQHHSKGSDSTPITGVLSFLYTQTPSLIKGGKSKCIKRRKLRELFTE